MLVEFPLGKVDEVGPSCAGFVCQGACGGDPAGVSAHGFYDDDVDGQAAHIAAHLGDACRHVEGRARIAGGVVGHGDVVVHGLGDAHHVDGHALGLARAPDLAAGVHGAVAPRGQKPANAGALEGMCQIAIVVGLERLPARADGRRGRRGEKRQLLGAHLGKVNERAIGDATHAAQGSQHPSYAGGLERLVDRSEERRVDDRGGTAAVNDEQRVLRGHARSRPSRSARPSRQAWRPRPWGPCQSCQTRR